MSQDKKENTAVEPDRELDTRGEVCPFPWVKAKKTLKKLDEGQVLLILGDHGPAMINIPHNFEDEGQVILKVEKTGEVTWEILVRKVR